MWKWKRICPETSLLPYTNMPSFALWPKTAPKAGSLPMCSPGRFFRSNQTLPRIARMCADSVSGFDRAGKIMQREYPDRPIVGVGAVIIEQNRVLLARRGNPPRAGQWSLPGGVVELGETLRAATEREALEETGLIVETVEVI